MAHSSNQEFKRHRAHKGADAARMSPTRFAPYRKILSETDDGREVLACGHTLRPREDMIGRTYPERRRCVECLGVQCAATGHYAVDWLAPNNIGRPLMRCRCGSVEPDPTFSR